MSVTNPEPATGQVEWPASYEGHTPCEIQEDIRRYGDWVEQGTWFYDTEEAAFYRLKNPDHTTYTFDLVRATQLHPDTSPSSEEDNNSDSDQHFVDNVTKLGGALLGGYLIGFPQGTSIRAGEDVVTNTGEYLFVYPDDPQAEMVSELAIERSPVNPRYQSLHPESFTADTEPTDTGTVIIYGTDGTLPGLSRLTTSHSPASPPPSDQRATSKPRIPADGGTEKTPSANSPTATVNKRVDTVPTYSGEDTGIVSRYVDTGEHPKETFRDSTLRRFVKHHAKGDRILNACAGWKTLEIPGAEIIRNDINPDRDADYHLDVTELATVIEEESIDAVIYDPPWSQYQSNLRYEGYHVHKRLNDDSAEQNQIRVDVRDLPFEVPGEDRAGTGGGPGKQTTLNSLSADQPDTVSAEGTDNKPKQQLGHARLAKLGFDYMLKPGGRVIQLAYTGVCMPASMNYERLVRTAFDPYGEAKTLIGCVDRKPNNTSLDNF